MDFDVVGSPATDCRGQQLGQTEAEDEEGSKRHSTDDHRNELMDVYSKSFVMHGTDLSQHLMRQEMELIAGGQEHSHSRFDIDVELVQDQSHSRFDVDEQLEMQLRFGLSSLDEAHMLLDANGPREGHWGVDFMRQEQSLTFHAASEENTSLLSSDGKVKDVKSFENCQTWSRPSSSHEDDHLYFAANSQAEVNSIANTFELKDRKLTEDSEELEAGQSAISCVNQEDGNSWFELSGKESLQPNADVRPQADVDNNDERKLVQNYMPMDKVRPHLKAVGFLGQEDVAGHCSPLLSMVHTQGDKELVCTSTMTDLVGNREDDVSNQDGTEPSLLKSEVSKGWHTQGMQQPAEVEAELRLKGGGGLVEKELEDPPAVIQSDKVRTSDNTDSPSVMLLLRRGDHTFGHTHSTQTTLEELNTFSQPNEEANTLSHPNKELHQVYCDEDEHMDRTCIDKCIQSMQFEQQAKSHPPEIFREQHDHLNCLNSEQPVESSPNAEAMLGNAYSLPGHSASNRLSTVAKALSSSHPVESNPNDVAMTGIVSSVPGHSLFVRVSTVRNDSGGTGGGSMDLGGAATESLCKSGEDDFAVDNLDVQAKKAQEPEFRSVVQKEEQLKYSPNEELSKGGVQATGKQVDWQDRDMLCLGAFLNRKMHSEPVHTESFHAALELHSENHPAAMEVSGLEEDSPKGRPARDIAPELQVCFKETEDFPFAGASIARSSTSEQQHTTQLYEMQDSQELSVSINRSAACSIHSEKRLPDTPSVEGGSISFPDSATCQHDALERETLFKEEQDGHVDHTGTIIEKENATESTAFECAEVGAVGGSIGADQVTILPGHSEGYVEVPCSDVQEVHSSSDAHAIVQDDAEIQCEVTSHHGDNIMTNVADCRGTHVEGAMYNDKTRMASIQGKSADLDPLEQSCDATNSPVSDTNACSENGGTVDSEEVLESCETDQCTGIETIIQVPLALGTVATSVRNDVPQGDHCGGSEAFLESSNTTNCNVQEVEVDMADFSAAPSHDVAASVQVNLSDTQNRGLSEAEQHDAGTHLDPFSAVSVAARLKSGGEPVKHLTEAMGVESLDETSLVAVRSCPGGNMHATSERSMIANTAAELDVTTVDSQDISENVNSLQDCKYAMQLSSINRETTEASQTDSVRFPGKSWTIVKEVNDPLQRDDCAFSKVSEPKSDECETLSIISTKEGTPAVSGVAQEDKNKPVFQDGDPEANYKTGCESPTDPAIPPHRMATDDDDDSDGDVAIMQLEGDETRAAVCDDATSQQTEVVEISKKNGQWGTSIGSSTDSDNPEGPPFICEANTINLLNHKEGEVGPGKLDSAVCQQTEHTLVATSKMIASDEGDAVVQVVGKEDSKVNVEDEISVESTIKPGQPAIDILEHNEVQVAAETVMLATDSDNTKFSGVVRAIDSCPQKENKYSIGSVVVVDRNMNDRITEEASFDCENMEIKNTMSAEDVAEEVQQNAYFETPVAHSQSVSGLDGRALRVNDASQKPCRPEAATTIGAFTESVSPHFEIAMTSQGKEKEVIQLKGNYMGAALQEKQLDAKSSHAANCTNTVPLADNKEKDLMVSCSSPLDVQPIQTKSNVESGASLGKYRSRQKKAETLSKSHVPGMEVNRNPGSSMSLVCELNPQGAAALNHGLRGISLATIDSSLSTGGNKLIQCPLPQAGILPVQNNGKIVKPLDTSIKSYAATSPVVIDINSSSALEELGSRKNVLEQRESSSPYRPLLSSIVDNPLISDGGSRKGRLQHPRQQVSIPDLNVAEVSPSSVVTQPFTDSQQVQLRAQILVYGSLIQGALPDEALMIPAFGDVNGARQDIGREAIGGGMFFWEKAWHAAADRIHGRTVLIAPKETAQSTTSGLLSTSLNLPARIPEGGARVNCFSSNPSIGNATCSVDAISLPVPSFRFTETSGPRSHTTRARQIPTTVVGRAGSRTVPTLFVSPHPPIVSSSTRVVPLPLSETIKNPQGGRASQLDPQQVLPRTVISTSQIAPFTPASNHWISSSAFPGSACTWIPPSQAPGIDGSVSFTSLQPFVGREVNQDLVSGRRSTGPPRVPFVAVADTFNSQVIASASNAVGTIDTGTVQKSNSGAGRMAGLGSRKRRKSQLETVVQTGMLVGSLAEGVSVSCGHTPTTLTPPLLSSSSSQDVICTMSVSNMALTPSPESFAMVLATSHLPAVVETPVLATTSIGVSAPLMTGSSMPASMVPQYQLVAAGQHQGRSMVSDSAIHDLEQAKLKAEEATSIAASAIRHSESMWSQLQSQRKSGIISDKEMKLASSAVAIAAAASVAKAAAAAARVAYEAALQAKLMGEEAMEFPDRENGNFSEAKSGENGLIQTQGLVQTGQEVERNTLLTWEMPSNCKSVIAIAKEAAKKRLEAASAARIRAHNIESVVRAAELAATAVSHAGAVVAMGDPIPFSLDMLLDAGHQGLQRLGNTDMPADVLQKEKVISKRSLHRSEKLSKGKRVEHSKKNTPREITESKERGSKQPYEVGIARVESETAGPSELLNIDKDSPGNKIGNVESRKDCICTVAIAPTQSTEKIIDPPSEGTIPAEAEVGPDSRPESSCANADQITEGSMVEVLSDEEGLRGVWFSAKVLKLENGKAFVIYDELLSDDDNNRLEEWIDLGNPSGKAPRLRLAHPMTRIKFEGTRKRRRAAMGNHIWSVGDRVDAWIRDGWWEGEVLDKSEEDETKVKVHFPGEGDTAFIKSWNLRPSLIWKDGHWHLWTENKLENNSTQEEVSGLKDEAPLAKRQKLDMAPAERPLTKQLKVDKETSSKEKVSEVRSDENQRLQGLNVVAVPVIGESQPENITRTRREGGTGKGVKKVQANEGSKVVFGVPKPTKKRKFIEVSKHYGSNRMTRSPKGKIHGKDERNKVPTSENQIGCDGVSKADDSKAKKPVIKHTQVKVRTDDASNRSKNVFVRNEEEIIFPGFGMGPRKEVSNQDAMASGPSPGKTDAIKSGKRSTPSDGHRSHVQRSKFNITTTMPKELSMRKQPMSSRSIAPSANVERLLKSRHPLPPTNIMEKEKAAPSPLTEVLEPRRSSRRIQPTSKLLEGLQSTPNLGKNHHSL